MYLNISIERSISVDIHDEEIDALLEGETSCLRFKYDINNKVRVRDSKRDYSNSEYRASAFIAS